MRTENVRYSCGLCCGIALGALAFNVGVATAASPVYRPAPIQRVHSARVPVAGTRQPCFDDSCANLGQISLACPEGTSYVTTHYFTNAGFPNDLADVYNTGLARVSYGRFVPALVAVNEIGQFIVTVYYYNRSDRYRLIAISIDCQ